jgi:hypothetical protein
LIYLAPRHHHLPEYFGINSGQLMPICAQRQYTTQASHPETVVNIEMWLLGFWKNSFNPAGLKGNITMS